MEILHLIIDHQVVENTIDLYEELFPGKNRILIFDPYGRYKHLKKYANNPCIKYDCAESFASNYNFTRITTIIAHYMSIDMVKFIKMAPNSIHVCWEIYGRDLYGQFLEPLGMELCYTKPYKFEKFGLLKHYFPVIYSLLVRVKGYHHYNKREIENLFKYISSRVDSLQHGCIYDTKYIEKCAGHEILKYEYFNYSLDKVLGEFINVPFFEGSDIMIGNSASFTNNHLYVLKYLKGLNVSSESNIILPLSYSGTTKYSDFVEKEYKKQFGSKVIVLRDYMPLQEYNKLFARQGAMILASWRQESIGNAIMGLYLGIKVFMSERSPLMKWFLDCGFKVFSLEKACFADFTKPMQLSDKKENRCIVLSRYNMNTIIQSIKDNMK